MSNSAAGALRNVNALPLIFGMDDRSDLVVDTPRRVVALFEQGQLEVALLPSIEVAKHEGWEVLLDCGAIVCEGPARTMIAVADKPWDQVRTIAVDANARTGAALARVLFANLGELAPTVERMWLPQETLAGRIPDGADAVVIVGEAALNWPGYEPVTGTIRGGMRVLDLGEAWTRWTGLPFVSLVWTARETRDIGEWHDVLHTAAETGAARIDEVAEFAAQRLQASLPANWLAEFFRGRMVVTLDRRHREAMIRFFNEAEKLGLAPVMGRRGIRFRPRDAAGAQSETSQVVDRKAVAADETQDFTEADGASPLDFLASDSTSAAPEVVAAKAAAAPDEPHPFFAALIDYAGPDSYTRAKAAFQRRRYRTVLTHLDRGAKADPSFAGRPDVALLRGRCELHLQRSRDARRSLIRAAADAGTTRMATYLLARLHMRAGEFEAAAERARSLLARFPDDISYTMHAHAILATGALQAGLTESAEYHRELAERRGLTSADLLLEHGKALAHVEMWDDAVPYFGEAVNVDPSNPEGYWHLASVFHRLGQWMKAEEVLAYGLDHAPEEVAFFVLIGDLRREQGKLQDATTLYRVALEHSPRGDWAPALIARIGHCLYEQGEVTEAREHFQAIAAHFGRSPEARRAGWFVKSLADAQGHAESRVLLDEVRSPTNFAAYAGPKVAAALFAFHGMEESSRDVPPVAAFESYGWPELRALLQAAGGRTALVRGSRERVRELLDARLPAIIGLADGLDDEFALVVGYDDRLDALFVRRGSQPPLEVIPWPEVERRWSMSAGGMYVYVPPRRADEADALELADDPVAQAWVAADAAIVADDADAARDHARAALAADMSASGPRKVLVELALQDRAASEALELCDAELQRQSRSFWAHKYRGDALLQLERYAEALQSYREAAGCYRREYTLWWAMGIAYDKLGNALRARQCLHRSLAIEHQPQVAAQLAALYERGGKQVRAAYWWSVAHELDPEMAEAAAALERYRGGRRELADPMDRVLDTFVRKPPIGAVEGTVAGHDQPIDELDDSLQMDEPAPVDLDADDSPIPIDEHEWADEDDESDDVESGAEDLGLDGVEPRSLDDVLAEADENGWHDAEHFRANADADTDGSERPGRQE